MGGQAVLSFKLLPAAPPDAVFQHAATDVAFVLGMLALLVPTTVAVPGKELVANFTLERLFVLVGRLVVGQVVQLAGEGLFTPRVVAHKHLRHDAAVGQHGGVRSGADDGVGAGRAGSQLPLDRVLCRVRRRIAVAVAGCSVAVWIEAWNGGRKAELAAVQQAQLERIAEVAELDHLRQGRSVRGEAHWDPQRSRPVWVCRQASGRLGLVLRLRVWAALGRRGGGRWWGRLLRGAASERRAAREAVAAGLYVSVVGGQGGAGCLPVLSLGRRGGLAGGLCAATGSGAAGGGGLYAVVFVLFLQKVVGLVQLRGRPAGVAGQGVGGRRVGQREQRVGFRAGLLPRELHQVWEEVGVEEQVGGCSGGGRRLARGVCGRRLRLRLGLGQLQLLDLLDLQLLDVVQLLLLLDARAAPGVWHGVEVLLQHVRDGVSCPCAVFRLWCLCCGVAVGRLWPVDRGWSPSIRRRRLRPGAGWRVDDREIPRRCLCV